MLAGFSKQDKQQLSDSNKCTHCNSYYGTYKQLKRHIKDKHQEIFLMKFDKQGVKYKQCGSCNKINPKKNYDSHFQDCYNKQLCKQQNLQMYCELKIKQNQEKLDLLLKPINLQQVNQVQEHIKRQEENNLNNLLISHCYKNNYFDQQISCDDLVNFAMSSCNN